MKLLLCLASAAFVIAAQALFDQQIQKRAKVRKECKELTEVTQESINEAHSGVVSVDPKLKKYIRCFSKKTGVATEADDNNVEVLKAKLKRVANDEEMDKMVQKCVVKKVTPEATAYDIFRCVLQQI
ncbi:hypothetical protein MTP99_004939 [Tenebrio molitor]|uniref:B1 protein-like n=1 Tax=Tenebrio molitor TaxID=7067 RepID=UPI002710FD91|nr:hypothetical protein MTP99_004939 [Tenebrio molitor]